MFGHLVYASLVLGIVSYAKAAAVIYPVPAVVPANAATVDLTPVGAS